MIPVYSPLLGLRMSNIDCTASRPSVEFSEVCDASERTKVMLHQIECTYSVSDYMERRSNKESSACHAVEQEAQSEAPELAIDQDKPDTVCREKMCEWSYRVCDHFQTGREIVAVSFSYLDRFVDKCSCDRSAFKLAAMTTLYMANKIYGGQPSITIAALSELSRGEFEPSHISDMEVIILETLAWRLHPPTAQCFIDSFFSYISVPSKGTIPSAIYQRAIFFAELSVYDYAFVPKEKSLIAIASLMNAMEGMDNITEEQQAKFVDVINTTFDLKSTSESIEAVRNRLWYVYSMSAQYKEDDAIAAIIPSVAREDGPRKQRFSAAGGAVDVSPSTSPVSVAATTHH